MRKILLILALLSSCNVSWAGDVVLKTLEEKRQDVIDHYKNSAKWIRDDVIEQVNKAVWFPFTPIARVYTGELSQHERWLIILGIKKELEKAGYVVKINEAYEMCDIGYMTISLPVRYQVTGDE